MTDFIIYLNLFTGPMMLLMALSKDMAYLPYILRIGFGLMALGLIAQSTLMITHIDRLHGIVTLWSLKDVGAFVVCSYWVFMAVSNRIQKYDEITKERVENSMHIRKVNKND